MPYLEEPWTIVRAGYPPDSVAAGIWVPETDWQDWQRRGDELQFRDMWRSKGVLDRDDLDSLVSQSPEKRQDHFKLLGQDLGSVQLDNFFYSNFAEQLKQSPEDATADHIINLMEEELGFESVKWPSTVGGPPEHNSPVSWKSTLKWLLKNMAKVGQFVLNAVDYLAGSLAVVGISAVTVAGNPFPSLGFEMTTDLFNDKSAWTAVRTFLEETQERLAKGF